ncbi:hypothetical protein WJX82_000775 [Trebouxia sp. C0006]
MGACALGSILASLLLCAEAASSDPFSSSHVATLGSDYAEKVSDGKLYFVKFYAPWCGHCKKLALAWSELGKTFENDQDVVIAHIDCTKSSKVCTKAKITGYPTLKLIFNEEEQESYKGGRSVKAMTEFLESQKHKLLQETEE